MRGELHQIAPVALIPAPTGYGAIRIEKSYRFFFIAQARDNKAIHFDGFDKADG
ncbi:MAG: hypothetical protein P8079_04785 [Gammaproteobacteria bacterium]